MFGENYSMRLRIFSPKRRPGRRDGCAKVAHGYCTRVINGVQKNVFMARGRFWLDFQ
jgi:hypothetical protein